MGDYDGYDGDPFGPDVIDSGSGDLGDLPNDNGDVDYDGVGDDGTGEETVEVVPLDEEGEDDSDNDGGDAVVIDVPGDSDRPGGGDEPVGRIEVPIDVVTTAGDGAVVVIQPPPPANQVWWAVTLVYWKKSDRCVLSGFVLQLRDALPGSTNLISPVISVEIIKRDGETLSNFGDSAVTVCIEVDPVLQQQALDDLEDDENGCNGDDEEDEVDECLGFLNEEEGEWESVDCSLQTRPGNGRQRCGETNHFSTFGILLSGGGGGANGCSSSSNNYFTGSLLWDTLTGVIVTLSILAVCVVIIVVVSFFPPARRLARGPEGERLQKARRLQGRTASGMSSTEQRNETGWEDVPDGDGGTGWDDVGAEEVLWRCPVPSLSYALSFLSSWLACYLGLLLPN